MRLVLLVAVVLGCGPSLRTPAVAPTTDVRARLTSRDPVALESLMHDSVVAGGLVFSNPECAAEFSATGEVKAARFTAFAKCLTTLELRPSQREYELDDIILLEYGTGYEVQARGEVVAGQPRLKWIGFDARAPVVTPAQFASLRMPQDNAVSFPSTLESYAHAWIDVCVTDAGSVETTQVREMTSPLAGATFEALVRSWRFHPMLAAGKPTPFCSHIRIARGSDAASDAIPAPVPRSRSGAMPVVIAPQSIEPQRTRGIKFIVPDDMTKYAIGKNHIRRAKGMFRVCVDETGTTESVTQLHSTGVPDYDRKIIKRMQEWGYQPYQIDGRAVPVCSKVTFIYTQR